VNAVATLNKLVATIPWMLFSGMAGVKDREFYEAPAGSDVAPKIDFGTAGPGVPVAPATPAAPSLPPTAAPPAVEPPAGASDEPPTQP
jgi:LemA protein